MAWRELTLPVLPLDFGDGDLTAWTRFMVLSNAALLFGSSDSNGAFHAWLKTEWFATARTMGAINIAQLLMDLARTRMVVVT